MSPADTDPFDLARFRVAQDRRGSFDQAMAELRSGRKTSHWIWWVFPQVRGLGSSPTSIQFALSGRDEAVAYLANEVLRSRLLDAVRLVHEQLRQPAARRIDHLLGSSIDALKLISSMTLFADVATDPRVRDLAGVGELRVLATEVLEVARTAGYPACEHTLSVLRSS